MNILLISDIHANFPALSAVVSFFKKMKFELIINAGDSLVYGPFPNESLTWLQENNAHSILGNTDKKVKKLLRGKIFKKPRTKEKRIMYTWTAETLSAKSRDYLFSLPTSAQVTPRAQKIDGLLPLPIDIFHGSPARDHEFLFVDTPNERFMELAALQPAPIVIVGHSHTPFHKQISGIHFINPGSVGRMFDGNPMASCAVLTFDSHEIQVKHYRIPYPIDQVTKALRKNDLPQIYSRMYKEGRKLN